MNEFVETTFSIDDFVEHKVIVCSDPCHSHNSPVQEMFIVPYRGYKVSVTKDGEFFNVRIDGDQMKTKFDLCWNEVEEYVERMTK